jgi:hypothetical protein
MNHSLRALRKNKNSTNLPLYEDIYRKARFTYSKYIDTRIEQDKLDTQQNLTNHKNTKDFWSIYNHITRSHTQNNHIRRQSWFQHYRTVFSIPGLYSVPPITIDPNSTLDNILDADFNVFETKIA